MIFTFKSKSMGFASTETSMEIQVDRLDEIMTYFGRFLKGCGYDIDGEIRIVKDGPPEQYSFTLEGLEVKEYTIK